MADKSRAGKLGLNTLLEGLKLQAATVIDVGVRFGTPFLYEAFPDASFILVDPQEAGETILQSAPKNYIFRNVALGATAGTLELHEAEGKSTVLERTGLTRSKILKTYSVPVMTMDDLIDELQPATPLGIKIDTEGFELEVLRGLTKHAGSVEFYICEVSVKKRFVNGYRFSEMIAEMKSRGFELHTILNPAGRLMRFYDCLFLPQDHRLFAADQ